MGDHQHAGAPQPSEGTPHLQIPNPQHEDTSAYALYYGDRRRAPGLPKHRHLPLRLKVQQSLAVLLPVLAVLAVFATCSRILPASRSFERAGRRLAAEGRGDQEEEQRAVVNACLALQEEFGLVQQAPLLLPSPQEAIPHILQFLLADPPPQHSKEEGGPVQQASLPLSSLQEADPQTLGFPLGDPQQQQAEEVSPLVRQAPSSLQSPQQAIFHILQYLLAEPEQQQAEKERDLTHQASLPLPTRHEAIPQTLNFPLHDPQPQHSREELGLFQNSPLPLSTPQQKIPQTLGFPLPDPQRQQAEEDRPVVQQAPSFLPRPQEENPQTLDFLFADPQQQQAEEERGFVPQAPFPLPRAQKATPQKLDFLLNDPQQKQAGVDLHQQAPLPSPAKEEAISQILKFLLADLPQEHAAGSQPPARPVKQAPPSVSPLPASSLQSGLSYAAPVQWGLEGFVDTGPGASKGAPWGAPEGAPEGAPGCLHSWDAAVAAQGDGPLFSAQGAVSEFVLGQKRGISGPQTSTATVPMKIMKGDHGSAAFFSEEHTSCWLKRSDPSPLPTPQATVPQILEYLLADLPPEHAVGSQPTAGRQAQAPSSALPASAFSPQPGPSHAAPVQWGFKGSAEEDLAARRGVPEWIPEGPLRGALEALQTWKEQASEPFLFEKHTSRWETGGLLQTSRDPFLLPTPQEAIPDTLELLLADLPQEHAVESQLTAGSQAQAPSSTLPPSIFSPRPGPSHAAPVQWGFEGLGGEDLAGWDAAAPMQGDPSVFPVQHDVPGLVSGQKWSISDPLTKWATTPTKTVKGADAPGPSPFNEHSSSWKGGGHLQTSPDPSPTTEGQPQQPAAEPAAESQLSLPQQHAQQQDISAEKAVVAVASSGFLSPPGPSAPIQGSAWLEGDLLQDASEGPPGSARTAAPPSSDLGSALTQPAPQLPLPPPAPSMPPSTHPYYRLPVLPPGVRVPPFDGPGALSKPGAIANVQQHLLRVRKLFLKSTLSAEDARSLLQCATAMIKHLRYVHRNPIDIVVRKAVEVLGIRYFLVEALFCMIQIIGPSMNASQWWPELIKGIPSYFTSFEHPRFSARRYNLEALAEGLSAALKSLKNGIRPDEAKTIWLKRELLGNPGIKTFIRRKWDPWREDDKQEGR